MEMIFETQSIDQTEELGRCLGKTLREGDFVALTGDLGAGKTAFTKGIARGLGIKEDITSPTFTIINEYLGRVPLAHMDVYRLKNLQELENIGFDDYLEGYVVVMEWADKVKELLPNDVLWVDIKILDNLRRQIRFISKSSYFDDKLRELSI